MKKVLLIAVLTACMFNLASAQESYKPKAGDFSLEVGFVPFSNESIIKETGLAGFIHFSDNLALRIGLGLGFGSASYDNGLTGNNLYTEKMSTFKLTLSPGVVYSFKGTPRLTPYIGGGLNVGFISTTIKGEDGNTSVTVKHPNGYSSDAIILGIGCATGFNYYVAKNLYVGAEIGLAFDFVSYPNEKVTVSGGGSSPAESKDKYRSVGLGINANPMLRLGWTF